MSLLGIWSVLKPRIIAETNSGQVVIRRKRHSLRWHKGQEGQNSEG